MGYTLKKGGKKKSKITVLPEGDIKSGRGVRVKSMKEGWRFTDGSGPLASLSTITSEAIKGEKKFPTVGFAD